MSFNITPFGNNYGSGPAANTAVPGGGVLVPFNNVASTQLPGTQVPCTGKVTGRFRIAYSVLVANTTGAAINGQAQVQINGANIAQVSQATVPATTGQATLSGVLETSVAPGLTPVNFTLNITGSGLSVTALGSSMEVQELDAVTG